MRNLCVILFLLIPFSTAAQESENDKNQEQEIIKVGDYGGKNKIVIQGLTDFDVSEIPGMLLRDSSVAILSCPSADLKSYLNAILDYMVKGLKSFGYYQAEIKVTAETAPDHILINVIENERYRLSTIELEFGNEFSRAELLAFLAKRRLEEVNVPMVFDDSFHEEISRKKSAAPAVYKPGDYVSPQTNSPARILDEITSFLDMKGYPFARIGWKIIPDHEAQTVILSYSIEEKGAEGKLLGLKFEGMTDKTAKGITRFLDLKEGMDFSNTDLKRCEKALWASARFGFVSVKAYRTEKDGSPGIQLVIYADEVDYFPPLSIKKSREEETMLKFGDWLRSFQVRDCELAAVFKNELINIDVFYSSERGVIAIEKTADGAYRNALVLSDTVQAFYVFFDKIKVERRKPLFMAMIQAQLNAAKRKNKDELPFAMEVMLAVNELQKNHSAFESELTVLPSCLNSRLYDEQAAARIDENNVFLLVNEYMQLELAAENGELISCYFTEEDLNGEYFICPAQGEFERNLNKLLDMTADFKENEDSKKAVTNLFQTLTDVIIRNLCVMELIQLKNPESLTDIIHTLLEKGLLDSLDKRYVKGLDMHVKEKETKPGFYFPDKERIWFEPSHSIITDYLSSIGGFSDNTSFFPYGSWLWTYSRIYSFVRLRQGNKVGPELQRLYAEHRLGPVASLIGAEMLIRMGIPDMANVFAQQGLKNCSENNFKNEFTSCLIGEAQVGDIVRDIIKSFSRLEPEEAERFSLLFPEEKRHIVLEVYSVLKDRENEIPAAAYEAMDIVWKEGLGEYLKEALTDITAQCMKMQEKQKPEAMEKPAEKPEPETIEEEPSAVIIK